MKRIYNVNSKDWYQFPGQAAAYLNAFSSDYAKTMVTGEDLLLRNNIDTICDVLSPQTTFIDLGPGNATKSAYLLNQFELRNKVKEYLAVDIQPAFLSEAKQQLKSSTIPQTFTVATFEDFLANKNNIGPSFIYLGATFGNFSPSDISTRLSHFMTLEDSVYLSCAKTPADSENMRQSYVDVSKKIFDPLAEKLGLDLSRFSVEYNAQTKSIEQGYFVHAQNEEPTFMVLGVSRKPSAEEFSTDVKKYFRGTFVENETYVGFIGGRRV